MRETEGLFRAIRFVRRLVVGAVALVVIVAAVGYLFLMRQVDPHSAWTAAQREIEGGMLHYGERPLRIARVFRRRPTNYFRAANGLLVATSERIIFVGIEPRDKLAGADAPSAILTAEFPIDTSLAADSHRIYWLTAPGLTLSRAGRTASFAASSGYAADLDSLAAYIEHKQRSERAAAVRDRALRVQIEQLLKEPLHYTVRRGDALSTIATRFGATQDQIREWNQLPNDRVRIGATLLVRPGR
ncbi:MAG: LysM peptidoglycan-binding domain-containing protein [Gemmatimonadaceae bacterium]